VNMEEELTLEGRIEWKAKG